MMRSKSFAVIGVAISFEKGGLSLKITVFHREFLHYKYIFAIKKLPVREQV